MYVGHLQPDICNLMLSQIINLTHNLPTWLGKNKYKYK